MPRVHIAALCFFILGAGPLAYGVMLIDSEPRLSAMFLATGFILWVLCFAAIKARV